MSEYRTLASEIVYQGRVFSLRHDRVRLPDDTEKEYGIVEHPGCAVIVPVDEHGRTLLIRQFRYATGEEAIEVPAGKIDPGEDPVGCAARELAEETGFRAGRLDSLGAFYTTDGMSNELAYLFIARDLLAGASDLQDGESIAVEWWPLSDAVAAVRSGSIRCGPSALALLLAGSLLGID